MLENLDFIKVLGYGLSGLSFLLIFMTFSLIRGEQKRDRPRKEILGTIRMFMGLVLLCVIVVGIFSIPTLSDNQKLRTDNQVLNTENLKVNSQLELEKGASILEENNAEISKDSVESIVAMQAQRIDTLYESLEEGRQKTDLKKIKTELYEDIDKIQKHNKALSNRDKRKLANHLKKISKELDKVIDINDQKK